MSQIQLPPGQSDPRRDQLLRLLAELNAQGKSSNGISFGCVIDGHGNTYYQSSSDLNSDDINDN
jgi:hypothetical protein